MHIEYFLYISLSMYDYVCVSAMSDKVEYPSKSQCIKCIFNLVMIVLRKLFVTCHVLQGSWHMLFSSIAILEKLLRMQWKKCIGFFYCQPLLTPIFNPLYVKVC